MQSDRDDSQGVQRAQANLQLLGRHKRKPEHQSTGQESLQLGTTITEIKSGPRPRPELKWSSCARGPGRGWKPQMRLAMVIRAYYCTQSPDKVLELVLTDCSHMAKIS